MILGQKSSVSSLGETKLFSERGSARSGSSNWIHFLQEMDPVA